MSMDKQKLLVDRLLIKSKHGLLDWKETIDEDRFRVSFSDSSLEVYMVDRPRQFENDYHIAMLNQEGSIVDSFSDNDLASTESTPPDVSWYTKMVELHSLAKRRALGSDAVLDAILQELD